MQDHSCEVTTSRHVTNHDWTILSEGERENYVALVNIIIILGWHLLYTENVELAINDDSPCLIQAAKFQYGKVSAYQSSEGKWCPGQGVTCMI